MYHEKALRQAVEAMGCEVTSDMPSLVVLNLPGQFAGKEKELVQAALKDSDIYILAKDLGAPEIFSLPHCPHG